MTAWPPELFRLQQQRQQVLLFLLDKNPLSPGVLRPNLSEQADACWMTKWWFIWEQFQFVSKSRETASRRPCVCKGSSVPLRLS